MAPVGSEDARVDRIPRPSHTWYVKTAVVIARLIR
jgi:hypothetical protein